MKYKLFIFAPDDEKVITALIDAAAQAGAGVIGNYSHCAFIQKGQGNWFSGPGSNPTIGSVGKMSRVNEVKIEMVCPSEKVREIARAIKAVHPYEEPEIDIIELKEV